MLLIILKIALAIRFILQICRPVWKAIYSWEIPERRLKIMNHCPFLDPLPFSGPAPSCLTMKMSGNSVIAEIWRQERDMHDRLTLFDQNVTKAFQNIKIQITQLYLTSHNRNKQDKPCQAFTVTNTVTINKYLHVPAFVYLPGTILEMRASAEEAFSTIFGMARPGFELTTPRNWSGRSTTELPGRYVHILAFINFELNH